MWDFIIELHRGYITFDFGLATVIIFVLKNHRLSISERWVGLLVFCYYIFDVFAASITYFNTNNPVNTWFYNLAQLPELSIFLWIFTYLINNKKIVSSIKIVIPIFIVTHIVNLWLGQGLNTLGTFTIIPVEVFIAFLAFSHLRHCVENIEQNPFDNFFFWFSIAALIGNAGGVPILATINWFNYHDTQLADRLYVINDIIYCSWFTLISFGLLWTKRQQKLFSSL